MGTSTEGTEGTMGTSTEGTEGTMGTSTEGTEGTEGTETTYYGWKSVVEMREEAKILKMGTVSYNDRGQGRTFAYHKYKTKNMRQRLKS